MSTIELTSVQLERVEQWVRETVTATLTDRFGYDERFAKTIAALVVNDLSGNDHGIFVSDK